MRHTRADQEAYLQAIREGEFDGDEFSMRPLLVGEISPKGHQPLHPWPASGAGGRLASILGVLPNDYLEMFDRENLCDWFWDDAMAMSSAMIIHKKMTDTERVVVLLGSKVHRAFGISAHRKLFTSYRMSGYWVVILPHPSGRCRMWNDPKNKTKARRVLREIGVKL